MQDKPKFTATPEMIRAAENLFSAMAFHDTVESIVKAFQTQILAANNWQTRPDMKERLGDEVIRDPSNSFMMSDADFEQYDRLCQEAAKAAGLKVSHVGNCPLLEAQNLRAQARRELIMVMGPRVGLTQDQADSMSLAKRDQFVDISLKLLAPFVSDAQILKRLVA